MKETFMQFLIDKGLMNQFINNCESYITGFDNGRYLPSRPDTYISSSFTWDETPEGHDFWRDLNDEWEQIVNG